MQNTNSKNLIIAFTLAVCSTLTAISAWQTVSDSSSSESSQIDSKSKIMNTDAGTELFFIPEKDDRVWHIINKFDSQAEGIQYNNSNYLFGKDSVLVINEFVEIPDPDELNKNLAYCLQSKNTTIYK
jgi:hypothetical protein